VHSYLWDSGGGANLTQLAMPFSVLLTKLYADRSIHKAAKSTGSHAGSLDDADDAQASGTPVQESREWQHALFRV
jgi:hypothetical protein